MPFSSLQQGIEAVLALQQQGRLAQADEACTQLVSQFPRQPTALHLWALIAAQQGLFPTALHRLQPALDLAADDSTLHHTHGRLLDDSGDLAGAVAAYERATTLAPQRLAHRLSLAAALRRSGKLDEAIDAARAAVRLAPADAEAHNVLGTALADAASTSPALAAEAAAAFAAALSLQPNFDAAHHNLAALITTTGSAADAVAHAQRAVAISPDRPEHHNTLGAALAAAGGDWPQAIAAYRQALALRPTYAEAHSNLAMALAEFGEPDHAIAAARRAVELEPQLAKAHVNLAMLLLSLGQWEQGWAEHEFRFDCNPRFRRRPFQQPQWRGEPLESRTLLLHAEQGFGDAIQFIRFAPAVAAAHPQATVILECHPELAELFRSVSGLATIIPRGQPLPPFKVHCSLMSLPLAMHTTLNTLPAQVPYLQADPLLVQRWRSRLHRQEGRKHVGLVWAGRPTHSNDRNRSLPLTALAPLAAVANVTFHSLQKGAIAGTNPIRWIEDHSAALDTFADTAAAITALDLVIAVDTAVAHLAGALGKEVWLLLPQTADWRWMRSRRDSPWYPTMQLFRQTRWGDWSDPVQQVAERLKSLSQR